MTVPGAGLLPDGINGTDGLTDWPKAIKMHQFLELFMPNIKFPLKELCQGTLAASPKKDIKLL